MKILQVIAISSILLLSSCKFYTVYYQDTTEYPVTIKESIEIYAGDVDRPYNVIGAVAVDIPGSSKMALNYLKKKAAQDGADAIIFTEVTSVNSFSGRIGLSGVAIKYK